MISKDEMNKAIELGEGLIGGLGRILEMKLSATKSRNRDCYHILSFDNFENIHMHTHVVLEENKAYFLYTGMDCGSAESYGNKNEEDIRQEYANAI